VSQPDPLARQAQHRAWYWYDWANSAYVTTVTTVLFAPYLISVAETAACGVAEAPGSRWAGVGVESVCREDLSVLGLTVAPGSLPSYIITFSTILSALMLPLLGAAVDRTKHKKQVLAGFGWTGAAAAALVFFATGENWQLGAFAIVAANLCLGASLVVNDSILCLIATEDERDRVSSRGWAFGYLGGGLLLAVNLGMVGFAGALGVDQGLAARLAMLSAAVWWAGFTLIPFRRLRNFEPYRVGQEGGSLVAQSFGQLWGTLRDLRHYRVAVTFLLAYLFFNDGIQTVIASASTYGAEQLNLGQGILIATILVVQFVGVAGALAFGRAAQRFGARRVILSGLALWVVIIAAAYFLPKGQVLPFVLLGVGIGMVLGGTQALARSFFSLLIPRGKEGEYFSFYHAMERGTSWFGTLTFGIVYQLTDSYRPAILALIAFFIIGGLLLWKVDARRGIREAGNAEPAVV
jgi:UMF1 family MFS transporter